jgi:hypothetical protein
MVDGAKKSNWIPIARCDRPPARGADCRIVWKRLSNLTLQQVEELRQKNHLLVSSRFEKNHRILVAVSLAEDLVIKPINGEAS